MHPKGLHKGVSKSFSYMPLAQTRNSIRVIQIHPGRGKLPIHCTIKHTTIDSEYVCVSYTWGDDIAQRHTILVNEERFNVRQNLCDFLITARQLKIRDWLWIDALCIDQNNIEERNHQVQQMARIYQQAKHVLVHIGHFGTWMKWTVLAHAALLDLYSDLRRPSSRLFQCYQENVRPIATHLEHRPYFKRLWTVQELALARQSYVVTSRGLLRLQYLAQLLTNDLGPIGSSPSNVLNFVSMEEDTCTLMHLSHAVDLTKVLQCADVRDHIYGLLGILDPPVSLAVDYSKTPGDLFLDVLSSYYDNKAATAGNGNCLLDCEETINDLMQALSVSVSVICYRCCQRHPASKRDNGESRIAQGNTTQTLSTFFVLPATGSSEYVYNDFDSREARCSTCTISLFNGISQHLPMSLLVNGTTQEVPFGPRIWMSSARLGNINSPWRNTDEQLRCVEVQCLKPFEEHVRDPGP